MDTTHDSGGSRGASNERQVRRLFHSAQKRYHGRAGTSSPGGAASTGAPVRTFAGLLTNSRSAVGAPKRDATSLVCQVHARGAVARIMGIAGYEVNQAALDQHSGEHLDLPAETAQEGLGGNLDAAALFNPLFEVGHTPVQEEIAFRMRNRRASYLPPAADRRRPASRERSGYPEIRPAGNACR